MRGSVSYIGDSFQVFNNNSYPWTNVRVELSDGITPGGYIYSIKRLSPEKLVDIPAIDFVSRDGKRFNPRAAKPKGIFISCDTPKGRGHFDTGWE